MTAFATLGSVSGRRVLGRYELLLPIASGGMATVWAARLRGSRGFQKIVAVKTIRAEMAEDPEFADMLLDEASLASRIRHPHVVEILDLGDHEGVPYIVMEWIDGEPLHVLIKEATDAEPEGGLPLPICVRIGTQLCAGLHAAHELRNDDDELVGLVHRDVSPQNVLVTWDGLARLVDFGIAKAAGRSVGQTVAGRIKGKTAYLAPEQILGESVDRRTDIFATGTLMYAMSTGKHPFRGVSDVDTLGNILSEKPPPRPGKVINAYPPQLEKVIMTALEKDPARRYQTANEMLRDLDRALPANKRISTDEEVASFVRGLLGPRLEDMRSRIKGALRQADERIADDARNSFTPESGEALLPDKPVPTGVRVVDRGRWEQAAAVRSNDEKPAGDADSAGSGVVGRVIPKSASRRTIPAAPRARAASSASIDGIVVPAPPPAPRLEAHAGPDTQPAPPDTESTNAAAEPSPDPIPSSREPVACSEQSPVRRTGRPLMIGIAAALSVASAVSIVLVRRSPSATPASSSTTDAPGAVTAAPSTSPAALVAESPSSVGQPSASAISAAPPSATAAEPTAVATATAAPKRPVVTSTPTAPLKPKPYKPTTI